MEPINDFFSLMSSFLWGWPMIVLLLGTHLFLTFRLRIPQRKLFTGIKLSVKKDSKAEGDVSQFGALATALAATIGTGNIVGVATAVALGGPGAVLWCWLTGIFGISTKYAEGLLAVKYRVKTADGRMLGGPMYALERGLGMKWLGILFAIFTALASFGIGCTVQANSIALLAHETFGVPAWIIGLTVCLLTALVILGGVKAIAKVCTVLVPFMALLYVLGCIAILCINNSYVWPAIQLINPVRQALVSSTATFWETVVICALTGLVLVSSILAYPDITYADGAALTKVAFSKIPYVGAPLLAFGILTFAFSTIIGWSYYGESAVNYLEGRRTNRFYRILFIVSLFFGSIINLDIIWNIADCMNALMAIPNLIALLLLSGVAAQETKKYLWSNRLDDEMEEVKDEI